MSRADVGPMRRDEGGVLSSRLVPPRPPPDRLDRPALIGRMRTALGGRLTAVLAGAGYGKSTALAMALAGDDRPVVWCSLDARLRGAASLIAHVTAGLASRVPGFGARPAATGPAGAQVHRLANEIAETVPDPLVIVLDDVHAVGSEAGEAVGLLVTDLPPQVSLALAGREPLPFRLGGLRVRGASVFDERDLALDASETAQLLRTAGAPADAAARVHGMTEGWVSGVILLARASAGGRTGGPTTSGQDALLAYLAEEVLADQSREVRDFLEATCVLDRFTPAIAAAVSGHDDAARICRQLVERHLFTHRLGEAGDWYRYHQLLQAALTRRLGVAGHDAVELHRRAARAWAAAGEPVESVRHLIAAGDHEAAAGVLEPIAETMLAGSDAPTLAGLLEEIPSPAWRDRPALVLAHATLLFYGGRLREAFAALEEAMEQLLRNGEHDRAATAYFQLITLQMVMGTPQDRGIDVGRRLLGRIAESAPMLPLSLIMMASEEGCACRYDRAEEGLARALALPGAGASPLIDAAVRTMRALFIDHPSGRSEEALTRISDAIATLEEHADEDALGFIVLALVLRALVLNHLGRFEAALADAVSAAEISERRGAGAGFGRVLAKLRAVAMAGLGRWDDLDRELLLAEPPERLLGSNYAFRIAAPAARLAARRADARAVERHVDLARRAIVAYGFSFDTPMWLCDLAECAWEVGRDETARELHAEALAAAERARTPWSRTRTDLVGALAWEGTAAGDAHLAAALERTAEHGHAGVWRERDRPYAAGLLARALREGIGAEGLATDLLAACGAEVLDDAAAHLRGAPAVARRRLVRAVAATPEPSPPLLDELLRDGDAEVRGAARAAWARIRRRPRAGLRLTTLGALRVERDGVEVPAAAFGRRRARLLLGLLITAGGPMHREQVVDVLWPDSPPSGAAAALRTTLHELRRALQPEIDPSDPVSVLVSEDTTLALRLGPRDSLDAAELTALAGRAADDPIAVLHGAEDLYRGAYLAEWPYEEWAEPRRRELAEVWQMVLARAAEAHLAAGRGGDAAVLFRRLLRIDPLAEAWHEGLMRALVAQGDRARALRQFHACRTILRRELGIEPSGRVTERYLTILRDPAGAPVAPAGSRT